MKDLEVIQENMDLLTEPKHASVAYLSFSQQMQYVFTQPGFAQSFDYDLHRFADTDETSFLGPETIPGS